MTPLVSVVVATYERGLAIAPTLRSIGAQTRTDLEVLVVSDGPPADGLAETVAGFDERFRLLALPERTRSQSGPNNLGREQARGRYVAYLGHDDLWLPEHLDRLLGALDEGFDFAVAGCIYLGPPGAEDELTWVTGLFESGDAEVPREHFFPPSSFAHVRDLPAAVGRWPDPAVLRLPVDTAFLLAAADAGCRFASTGEVSVVKFASALRYLSYLAPSDAEQLRVERLLADPAARTAYVDERLAEAHARGTVMSTRHAAPQQFEVGERLAANEQLRGIAIPAPAALVDSAWIGPGEEWRGFDWHGPEWDDVDRWRWSGPSPRPRLALPWTHPEPVHVRVHLRTDPAVPVTVVEARVDGEPVDHRVGAGPWGRVVELRAPLRAGRASVLELETSPPVRRPGGAPDAPERLVGVALIGIEVETDAAAAAHPDDPTMGRAALAVRGAQLERLELERRSQAAHLARLTEELALTHQHAANLEGVVAAQARSITTLQRQVAQAERKEADRAERRRRRAEAKDAAPGPA